MVDAILTGTAKELTFRLARIAEEDDRVYDLILHKEKRSLNSNNYYWSLLSKVADKLRISKKHLHNDMLRSFGQVMLIDGKPVCVMLPDTDESEATALESSTVHLKPTSATFASENGITYRQWKMLRGSHDYNSSEMAVLISGIVQEAQQLGIPTLTPDELAEMRMLEEMAEQRRKKLNE